MIKRFPRVAQLATLALLILCLYSVSTIYLDSQELASEDSEDEEGHRPDDSDDDRDEHAIKTVYHIKYTDTLKKPSPFEKRTGKPLPVWAQKHKKFDFETGVVEARELDVCFVHVGKTAGSTLACMLGFKYECDDSTIIPGGYLPQVSRHLIHNYINDCRDDDAQGRYFLFATRNPLERMKSWFDYEKITAKNTKDKHYKEKKPLFVDCAYTTLSELAERGLSTSDDEDEPTLYAKASKKCQARAWNAIRGKTAYCRHNYYNYEYFLKDIPKDSKLLVMRTEHLEKDWNSVEGHLRSAVHQQGHQGGGDHENRVSAENFESKVNKTKNRKTNRDLTPRAQKLLCRALCDEIQAYKHILFRATNLSKKQIDQSLQELAESCPEEVSSPGRCASIINPARS